MIALDDEPRVTALRALSVLDTPPEGRFDRLTRLAAAAFKVPMRDLAALVEDELNKAALDRARKAHEHALRP